MRIALQALFGRGCPPFPALRGSARALARAARPRASGWLHHLLADALRSGPSFAQVLALEADLALDHFPGIDQAQRRSRSRTCEPDSPTRPAISPRRTVRSTPSTWRRGFGMECGAQSAHLQNGLAHVSHPLRANRHAGIGCRSIGVPRAGFASPPAPLEKRAALRGVSLIFFGSRLSRRRSPTMLMDRISSSRAMPGTS